MEKMSRVEKVRGNLLLSTRLVFAVKNSHNGLQQNHYECTINDNAFQTRRQAQPIYRNRRPLRPRLLSLPSAPLASSNKTPAGSSASNFAVSAPPTASGCERWWRNCRVAEWGERGKKNPPTVKSKLTTTYHIHPAYAFL